MTTRGFEIRDISFSGALGFSGGMIRTAGCVSAVSSALLSAEAG